MVCAANALRGLAIASLEANVSMIVDVSFIEAHFFKAADVNDVVVEGMEPESI